MEILLKYFPDLSPLQRKQFRAVEQSWREWNSRINVVSRKDIDNLFLHHILHSLSIARIIAFLPGARVLDLGTGGGLPGIPLAILFPETEFLLIDGTGKKINVVQAVSEAAGLQNVSARKQRAEEMSERFDFVVTRAVASLEKLLPWSIPLLSAKQKHAMPNGLIALKGGSLQEEIRSLPKRYYSETFALSGFFEEAFFEEKYAVYVQG